MKQQDLLLVLRAFSTFSTGLQKLVEDKEYYTEGEYESPTVAVEPLTPTCSFNEKLFKSLFPTSIEVYLGSSILEQIDRLPLEKGLVEGREAVFKFKSKGKKKVKMPCRVADNGLSSTDVQAIIAVAEHLIFRMPKGMQVTTRDKVLERLICRFAVQQEALPEFWQFIQKETGEKIPPPKVVLK